MVVGLQFFILQPTHVPSCLAPQASRTRSIIFAPGFSHPFSARFSLSLLSFGLPTFVSLPPLSYSLEICLLQSFDFFFFFAFSSRIRFPPTSNSSSTGVFVTSLLHRTYILIIYERLLEFVYFFFSFNHRYNPRRTFYLSMQHRYDPAATLDPNRPLNRNRS